MRRQSSLWRLAAASVGLMVLATAVSAQTPELYFRARNTPTSPLTERQLDANSPRIVPRGNLPVLFVHGHNLLFSNDVNRNYRKNWQDPLNELPSFMQTLDLTDNAGLGIEDYYIRFQTQGRSIDADADEIGAAIELILHRHDPDYPLLRQTTNVQVVIIAYSKGTISSRLYLKKLADENRRFKPVSEFIALAPPNHGLKSEIGGTTCAGQQLVNGMDEACAPLSPVANCLPSPLGFFRVLNGHPIPIDDTLRLDDIGPFETEAPGSRPDILDGKPNRPTNGTLYVTLFANSDVPNPDGRDFVGGDHQPTADCRGRRLAKNLSPDAVNISLADTVITNNGWETLHNPFHPLISDAAVGFTDEKKQAAAVHQNTVHTPEVICQALYTAVHHRSPAGQTCAPDPNGIPVIPPPTRAAAMLTLDFSGSMSARACDDVSNPICTNTRAFVLKQAVELFVRLWTAVSVPSDRLGVVYFRTAVDRFQLLPSLQTLPPLSEGGPAIIMNVRDDQQPGGFTAMGGGLRLAIRTLTDEAAGTPIRRVILFTDGMQNVNPLVVRNASGQLVIAEELGPPAVPLTVLDGSIGVPPPNRGIAVDTIGIGAAGDFVNQLEEIAVATGGHKKTTVDLGLLREFFVEELINALKDFSPQLVAYRRGAIAGKGSTESFAIEDGVRKLVLKVSWKSGESLDFSVAKDGVDVTSAGRFINGGFYKIFAIDLPAKGPIAARGNWQVRINGKAATTYEAAAIVDGSQISYDAAFDAQRPKAGDPLNFVVRLTAGGQPIAGGPRVTLTLLSPMNTAGDIIARNPPKDLPSFEPGMTIGERQLLALAQDPRTSAALKPKQEKFVLQSNDKGEFRTQLRPKVPGIYTVFVTIDGDNSSIGQFSRTLTATTVVRFANADRKASNIFVTECTDVVGRRYVRLVLTPRDTGGHYLGPGSPSAISLSLSAGRTVGGVRDLGDGGYMLLLEMARADDPIITLDVAGGAIFTGRLSQLSRMSRP